MTSTFVEGVQVGKQIIEGKTKIVYDLPSEKGACLIVSKDRITAGDGAKANDMEGKAEISTSTLVKVFEFLDKVGVSNHFIRRNSPKSFIAKKCHMIPIEFVTRRIATGSFLRRCVGVPEGYKFTPPKLEFFYKDDAKHDPQWCYEQIVSARIKCGEDKIIDYDDLDILSRYTVTIFEILERAWLHLDCQLVDMKVEFGVDETGELILSDTIDSDSWRLWPHGDKRMMLDKQVYRNMQEVTQEGLDTVKRNFEFVADKLEHFAPTSICQAVVLIGSTSDMAFAKTIKTTCFNKYGFNCVIRVTSAHKGPSETLNIIAEYESSATPIVIIAVAGRSNGLGPLTAGSSCIPVINCPPSIAECKEDIWSSLRLPSGLGCSTVISPEAAAQMAAQIFALNDHVIWAKLRAHQCNIFIDLKNKDRSFRKY